MSRARRTVESAFGILTNRFRLLTRPMDQQYENCIKSVQAMVVLHNYLRRKEIESNINVNQEKIKSTLGPMANQGKFNASGNKQAKEMRDKLADYFMSDEGQVDFQWQNTFGK